MSSSFIPYDEEEQDLLSADENELYELSPIDTDRKQYLETAAQNTITTRKVRINLFVFEKDVATFKQAARREGIPYQTLIASVLHKYNEGRLVDR